MLTKFFKISPGQESKPDRESLFALFIAFAIAVSPHAARLPVWFALLALVIFGWCYRIISANRHSPGKFVRMLVLIAVVTLLFRHYNTILGRDAGVAMLIALTMLKFLELKTLRDCMLVVFLCMFIALTSFLYSQSIWLGFYLMSIIVLLFTVLMYLNHHRARMSIIDMLKRSGALVLMGIPVAALLFTLFPRLHGGLFVLPGDSHAGRTGMSDTMKPGSINQLNLSEQVAFRVEFAGQVPPMQKRYWRGLVLEVYDQGTWKESSQKPQQDTRLEFNPASQVDYTLMQEASNQKWIFPLDLPVKSPPNHLWGPGLTLRSNRLLRDRQRLKLTSALDSRITEITDRDLMRNIDTSSVGGNRIKRMAEQLYQQSATDEDYANAVLNFYRASGFTYSLRPPLLGDNPVETFMFDTREGYCEHYASSFTAMMRLAGIPARVVIGYQGGEWNDQGDYMIVRQSDAHAWSEVWFENVGWVRVDPTAAVAPERIEYGLAAIQQLVEQGEPLGSLSGERLQSALQQSLLVKSFREMRLFWDGVNTRWYRWIIGYGTENQESLLRWLGLAGNNIGYLGVLLVILSVLAVSLQAWLLFRREKALDAATIQYKKYCKRLAKIGFSRGPAEGPVNFAKRVIRARPDLKPAVRQITERYVKIVYRGVTGADEMRQLADKVKKFRPKMLKNTT